MDTQAKGSHTEWNMEAVTGPHAVLTLAESLIHSCSIMYYQVIL